MSTTTLTPQISVAKGYIDKVQIARYAANLGLDVDTPMKIRLFAPKNIPEALALSRGLSFTPKGKTKAISNAKHGYMFPFDLGSDDTPDIYIQKRRKDGEGLVTDPNGFGVHYAKGYNIYGVVNHIKIEDIGNSTGSDDNIVACRALFYEIDDISIERQWEKLAELESKLGRKATMVVQTYKSLHVYFTLVEPCDKGQWIIFQQRLIQGMDSDTSLWNPSRIMRLPGFPYRKYTNGDIKDVGQVEIVQEFGNRFALAEFNGILPDWDSQRWEQKIKSHNKQAQRTTLKGFIDLPKPEDMPPFDMRLLTPYLPDYVQNGRAGWDTARCPVHALEGDHSGDSLHVNRETGAYVCHAGCNTQAVWKASLGIALTAGFTPIQPKKWRSLPFKPDFKCDSRHFPTDIPRPTQKLVIVGGAVGLGKSHLVQSWLKNLKAKAVEAVLPRVTLERDSAGKYGLKAKTTWTYGSPMILMLPTVSTPYRSLKVYPTP